ncbi:MAG TPA: carbohydrate-binding protein [Chryseosolibacter sp.]|nr:carbohydrate-binding protein [Chryseosolibacter sp.]
MRSITKFFCMALLVILQHHAQAQNYQLVWSDEFNYSGLPDAGKWTFEDWAPRHVNNELQRYVPNRLENCRVENGMLVIEARRDWYNGSEYSSARIHSAKKGSWTYGRMEARMRLPGGLGTWPAFWMMPDDWTKYGINPETNSYWPNCGEIDIMEYVGYDKGKVHGSVHSSKYYFKKGNQRTGTTTVADAETAFHVYAIEWSASKIDFFVDNTKYYTVTNDGTGWESYPFNYDFHLIFNLAVGGDWGGAQGVDPNIWPRRLEVDYVRVYKQAACPVTTTPATIQAESYCLMNGVQLENTSDGGGGQNVGWIDTNDWMTYRVNVPTAGSYKIQYRVASQNGGGSIRFERAGGSPVFGTISVPSTGGWQTWTTISHNVDLPAGEQEVAIAASAGGFNINWFNISANSAVPIGQTVWLRGSNSQYVSSENGTQAMRCNRPAVQAWEQFTVVDAGGGKIALRSQSKYVSSENGAQAITCNRASISEWEKFDWVANSNGTISLRGSNGRYISSENGTQAMTCNRATAGGWEQFTWGGVAGARLATSEVSLDASEGETEVLAVYPNPSSGRVTIKVPRPSQVKIFDASGRTFHSSYVEESLTVEKMNAGIYMVRVQNSLQTKTEKLVIK